MKTKKKPKPTKSKSTKKIVKGIKSPTDRNVKVTPRIKTFIAEYMIDKNGTRAATKAGYSKRTANEQAARLLANVSIKEMIAKRIEKQQKRLEMSADDVMRELSSIALCDIRKAYDEEGNLLPIKDMPDDIAAVVSAFEVESKTGVGSNMTPVNTHTKKVKFWDKLKALELIGKHFKMFTDRVEHDVSDSLADKMAEARKRVNGTAKGK